MNKAILKNEKFVCSTDFFKKKGIENSAENEYVKNSYFVFYSEIISCEKKNKGTIFF
jgi:hypothetical protein